MQNALEPHVATIFGAVNELVVIIINRDTFGSLGQLFFLLMTKGRAPARHLMAAIRECF